MIRCTDQSICDRAFDVFYVCCGRLLLVGWSENEVGVMVLDNKITPIGHEVTKSAQVKAVMQIQREEWICASYLSHR